MCLLAFLHAERPIQCYGTAKHLGSVYCPGTLTPCRTPNSTVCLLHLLRTRLPVSLYDTAERLGSGCRPGASYAVSDAKPYRAFCTSRQQVQGATSMHGKEKVHFLIGKVASAFIMQVNTVCQVLHFKWLHYKLSELLWTLCTYLLNMDGKTFFSSSMD